MKTFDLPTRAATVRLGERLGELLRPGDVVALIGDLGTGKTTLTQAIARGMGITADVSSPTFALVHEYYGPIPLFHFDPYRLDRCEDLADLGFEEYFHRGGVIVVEWADKVADLLPAERLSLRLDIPDEAEISEIGEDLPRELRAEGLGERYRNLVCVLDVPRDDSPVAPDIQSPFGQGIQAHTGKSGQT